MNVLVICLNPTIQRTFVVDRFRVGEVNRAAQHRTDASGKGVNLARVLVQLGVHATHLTHSGGRDGPLFRGLAEHDGIEMDVVDADIEIRVAHTIVDRAQGSTTELVEEGREVPPDVEGRLRARFLRYIRAVDGIAISGSKAPGFSPDLFAWMVGEARRNHTPVLSDYRGEDLQASLARSPHIVKPNLAEFVQTFLPERVPAEGLSEHVQDASLLADVREKMLELHERYGSLPVVTRGAYPTLFVENGQVAEESPIEIEPVNTIGSGDAFAAGFFFKYLSGESVRTAVHFGHECAALNAGILKPGVIRFEASA